MGEADLGSCHGRRRMSGSRGDKELTLRGRILFSTVSPLSREGSVVEQGRDIERGNQVDFRTG